MKRRRFLYSVAGLTLSVLLPGEVARASADTASSSGSQTVDATPPPAQAAGDTIYLTFDDGYVGMAEKVEALNALGVQGTFFLTGQAINSHPSTVQLLVNSGHILGNHTYDHSDLTKLGYSGITRQVQLCEQAAQNVAGVSTMPLLRPPYGSVNETVRGAAADLGYQSILWDWDTRDWAGSSPAYIEQQFGSGIVLMHTQGRNTVAALSDVVPALAGQGYNFAVL